jgi:hypothetical protein
MGKGLLVQVHRFLTATPVRHPPADTGSWSDSHMTPKRKPVRNSPFSSVSYSILLWDTGIFHKRYLYGYPTRDILYPTRDISTVIHYPLIHYPV